MRTSSRAAALAALACALGACAPKVIRFDAGAFSLLVPKRMPIEVLSSASVVVYHVRLEADGPVCATLMLTHVAGGPCSAESLRLQRGDAPVCAEDGASCIACVESEGTAAQLQAKAAEDLECAEPALELLRTLRVRPALRR